MMKFNGVELGEQLPTIEGDRVRLRWLTERDVPALFAAFGDEEVTRYWGFSRFMSLDDAAILLDDIQRMFHAGTLFQWGIEATASPGDVIGTCTLAELDAANRRASLGFVLARAHWGRGHASAAVAAMLRFAFETLGLHRIVADSDPRNGRSIRLLERMGFRGEGMLREHYWMSGEWQDAVVFGMLRSEWRPAESMLSAGDDVG